MVSTSDKQTGAATHMRTIVVSSLPMADLSWRLAWHISVDVCQIHNNLPQFGLHQKVACRAQGNAIRICAFRRIERNQKMACGDADAR
jgi:hypothetical protein